MLTRDAILTADDIKTVVVAVPEWGGDVNVREFDGAARDALDAFISKRRDDEGNLTDLSGIRAKTVSLAVCDDSGALLFTADDIPALEKKSSLALERVYKAARLLNLIGETEAAKRDFLSGQSRASGIG